jgi:hypothetical protein
VVVRVEHSGPDEPDPAAGVVEVGPHGWLAGWRRRRRHDVGHGRSACRSIGATGKPQDGVRAL